MRPKIICHMISSVDGRLLPGRWTPPAEGIAADIGSRLYEATATRLGADGWIVGRTTMQPMAKGTARTVKGLPIPSRNTHVVDRGGRDVAIAFDPGGKLHYGRYGAGGDHVIAVLGKDVPDRYLAELREDGVSYLFAGEDGRDLELAMNVLGERFGLGTLLLEGGGKTNGAFLKAGLIDELSLLVFPGIDGLSGIASIFEYEGGSNERPALGRSMRHTATETLEGGVVWLRYSFEPATGSTDNVSEM